MCGRYNITDDPSLRALLDQLGINIGPLPARFNIAPTEQVPVIHQIEGKFRVSDMRWWLVPHWSDGPTTKYAMFNARAENLEKSRAFKGPFQYRRALLPASSFIEWSKDDSGKQPWLVQPEEGAFAFAGLWDYWTDGTEHLFSTSMITTAASDSFKSLHGRMPLALDPEQAELWLDESTDMDTVRKQLKPDSKNVIAVPVEKTVGNARIKSEPRVIGDRSDQLHLHL